MRSTFRVRCSVWVVAGGLLLFVPSCKIAPTSKSREEKPAPSTAAKSGNDFDLNLSCVIDSIQNPGEAFHYTYKKDTEDNNLIQDADITPDND